MGSVLDEDGASVFAHLSLTEASETPKREKIRIRIRTSDKPAPTEKVFKISMFQNSDIFSILK
jgi:hypothetical protein